VAGNKTKATATSVEAFLDKVPNATRRADAYTLLKLMKGITRQPAKMWGPSIVGFGSYHYKYATGREGDIPMAGFSPRSAAMTIYVMSAMPGFRDLLARLGKCKSSVACLYVNKLADVDQKVLGELIAGSYRHLKTHGLHGDVTERSARPRGQATTKKPRARRRVA
jgi:hypothetical protein